MIIHKKSKCFWTCIYIYRIIGSDATINEIKLPKIPIFVPGHELVAGEERGSCRCTNADVGEVRIQQRVSPRLINIV